MQNSSNNIYAAVDLGSNSFHMIIARLRDGHFQVVDKIKEMVQLRAGLDEDGLLSDSSQQRALACLERFGQRIADLPIGHVRVVGTNTLRVANNSQQFLKKARLAIGRPIEIIAGEEEARLIYLGVAYALAFDDKPRLVIDIGGGSTEYIIGEGIHTLMRESLEMGCVSFSQRFFDKGKISKKRMDKAMLMASADIRSIQRPYRKQGWIEAVGASGTIRTVANIINQRGWADDGIITDDAIEKLIDTMIDKGHIKDLDFDDVDKERAAVLPGGVAVLAAAFKRLKIGRMTLSDGALREGLLYDLRGRLQHDDERDRTVIALARRYQVDEPHAQRVKVMAVALLKQVADDWQLNEKDLQERLSWAALMHEVGLAVSHDQFHKHSAYLVRHSTLPGFSREDQQTLATLIEGQRKKLPVDSLKELPDDRQVSSEKLLILLRLSILFNRGRSEKTDTYVKLKVTPKGVEVILPNGWLSEHPLTKADLKQEQHYLEAIDCKLTIESDSQ